MDVLRVPNQYEGVHCYDEWTPLKEVLLASVLGASHTVDPSFRFFYNKVNVKGDETNRTRVPDEIAEEHEREIQDFASVLRSAGVVVREQQRYEFLTPFKTPYWKAYSRPSDNPRDQFIIIGDTIVETPPVVRDRYFENDAWKPHLYGYFSAGSRWITAPRPMMLASSYDWDAVDDFNREAYTLEESTPIKGPGVEMMFDGAQIVKVGVDLIMNVRNANDHLGFQWMRREFPQYRWHAVNLGPDSDHIDGELAILRPGLLLVGHRLLGKIDLLPDFMQSWDVVPMLDREEHNYGLQLASDNIYINVLSLDENTVVISEDAHITIRNLERKGIECIRIPFHDSTAFGGGIHCSTLDVRRTGNLEDYTQ
jgi:glycine amidinotransferase